MSWPSTSGLTARAAFAQRQRFVFSVICPTYSLDEHCQPLTHAAMPYKRSYRASGQRDKPLRSSTFLFTEMHDSARFRAIANFSSPDSRWPLQRREGALGMEFRWFILRTSSRRQLRCLPPSRIHLPRSLPSRRQYPRSLRVLGPRWHSQQVQLPS